MKYTKVTYFLEVNLIGFFFFLLLFTQMKIFMWYAIPKMEYFSYSYNSLHNVREEGGLKGSCNSLNIRL